MDNDPGDLPVPVASEPSEDVSTPNKVPELSEPSEDIQTPIENDAIAVETKITFDFTKPKLVAETNFDTTFTRGCKWSPDGLCILLCNDDHTLRIFDYETELNEAVKVQEGEALYDFQWYPLMDSSKPETCCFATTSQGTLFKKSHIRNISKAIIFFFFFVNNSYLAKN